MGCRTRLRHVIAQKTGREERQNELYRKSSCVLDTKRHILKSAGGFPCHRFEKKTQRRCYKSVHTEEK